MLEFAIDSAPYAGAAYLQFRLISSALRPDGGGRSGWICTLLPWICR